MRHTPAFLLFTLLAIALPACAQSGDPTAKDESAISKDAASIERHRTVMERDRLMKEENKAKGNRFGQFVNSLSLGYDHFMIGEKKSEKAIDEEIMNHESK